MKKIIQEERSSFFFHFLSSKHTSRSFSLCLDRGPTRSLASFHRSLAFPPENQKRRRPLSSLRRLQFFPPFVVKLRQIEIIFQSCLYEFAPRGPALPLFQKRHGAGPGVRRLGRAGSCGGRSVGLVDRREEEERRRREKKGGFFPVCSDDETRCRRRGRSLLRARGARRERRAQLFLCCARIKGRPLRRQTSEQVRKKKDKGRKEKRKFLLLLAPLSPHLSFQN